MSEISMQKLKEQRLTPAEKFVLDKIKSVKASEPYKNGDVIWYKDSEWLFEQDFKHGLLWVNNLFIYVTLENKYNLNDGEIIQLLTRLLHKYTNNGQLKISF